MGNKQSQDGRNRDENNEVTDRRLQQSEEKKSKTKGSSCFGATKQSNPNKSKADRADLSYKKSSYYHDTRKSSIKVNNLQNAKIDDKLFADRQNRARLDIKMKRAEPYEILKDSDYFDSELNDKIDLEKLKKVYDSCEIANYKTPQPQKLQTVQIKTYLFDRNLTKIQA